jgi:hypothetical protein
MVDVLVTTFLLITNKSHNQTLLRYTIGAKHSKLKGLLNLISIAGSDNPLVELEYKGKQSNVILTTQGESRLKIFGE